VTPRRYAKDEVELEAWSREAKASECPHCRQAGYVNRHGSLRGLAEDGRAKDAVRGRRFFCSNRGHRQGCGHTFSIWLAAVIAGASVRSGLLWRFYLARLSGTSVLGAWESLRSPFSLEAAYRWWRRWRRGQCVLRTVLARGRDPPSGDVQSALAAVYGADDPIGVFQCREQRGWP